MDISISGCCLWNNRYLFVGCSCKMIKLIDLNKKKIIKTITKYIKNTFVNNIKRIIHPKYGKVFY